MKKCECCGAEVYEDSDEPVTEEWLRAVGFYDDSPGRFGLLRTKGGLLIRHDGTRFWLNTIITADTIYLPTRGHVRRICAALGVPLKEPG